MSTTGCSPRRTEPQVEQWRVFEIQLNSSKEYANPFLDMEVNATFTGPGGVTITRPVFWDGEQTWKIRFAPTLLGEWRYRTSSSDASNRGLEGIEGSLKAVPYSGKLPIYQHGFIQVSDNHRYLVFADNTPFFYMGDTHWFMAREKWDRCNKPGCTSEFRAMVDKRVAQKFTVYQSEPHPLNGVAWNKGVTEVNPKMFTDIDRKFQYIADHGMVHATALGAHSTALDLTGPGAARLARYWVARYGAYPVLWFTAQEFDINYPEYADIWVEAAKTFAQSDGYRHPITGHYYATALGDMVTYWGDEAWHNYYMLQNGHKHQNPAQFYEAYWNLVPPKPFLESEANYDDIFTGTSHETAVTAQDVRLSAYLAIQSGSLGFGYGANGIWNDIYSRGDAGCCVADYGFTSWNDAIDFESGDQMTHLIEFYTALDWWKLEPRFDDPAWSTLENPARSFVKSDGNRVYVVYFADLTTKTGTLNGLKPGASYLAKWFNPRSGESAELSQLFQPSPDGRYEIPPRPDEMDWLLLVQMNASTSQ